MVRFRAPANVLLRRAQLSLILAVLIPTILMIALGIVMVAIGSGSKSIVAGLLVIVFCTTSITGYVLGSIFVSKGASQARFQNDFLSSVTHELRTPLTSISMFIETLRDERLTDPEKLQCLDLLHQEVNRLGGLVERLLSLSRIEAGQPKLRRDPVFVARVIEDALGSFDVATLTDKVAVDVEMEDSGLEVLGDHDALVQAVANLLINAYKYTAPDDRRIEIRVRATDKQVEIAVIDNGAGIPRTEQRQILERFERGRGAIDSSQPGSGLGLAIVRAVVRAHRGKIEIRSKVGEGSEFRLRLRRA